MEEDKKRNYEGKIYREFKNCVSNKNAKLRLKMANDNVKTIFVYFCLAFVSRFHLFVILF